MAETSSLERGFTFPSILALETLKQFSVSHGTSSVPNPSSDRRTSRPILARSERIVSAQSVSSLPPRILEMHANLCGFPDRERSQTFGVRAARPLPWTMSFRPDRGCSIPCGACSPEL